MPNDARHWVSLSFLFFFLPLLFRLVSAFESLLITIFELLQIFFFFFFPAGRDSSDSLLHTLGM